MTETRRDLVRALLQATTFEWLTTLSLVFGGCCSNAWALELVTAQNPRAGTLITFAQFVLVALYGLRTHLVVLSVRDLVLERVVSGILKMRGQEPHDKAFLVTIEGPLEPEAHRFAEDAAARLRQASDEVSAVVINPRRHLRGSTDAVARTEFDVLQGDVLERIPHNTIVLVVPTVPNVTIRWDYTVHLVQSPASNKPPAPGPASLTVDITRPSSPRILPPIWHILPKVRLTPRAIPLSQWVVQVLLFLLTSLLNNVAFGYAVPMAVHIIFRSGGLVVNMLIGRLVGGRRYTAIQVVSVLLVTLGVACTTLSATPVASAKISGPAAPGSYFVGILLLTLALVLSGLMGLAQDRAYERYGRGHWQEALFYLHFLALPGFIFVSSDIFAQIRVVNASARAQLLPGLRVPVFYAPLLLNIVTQLVCVTGVHRLTSRVNSLTVTLVLVVRKAVSLGISVLVLGSGKGGGVWLWGGAGLVLAGTVGYSMGGSKSSAMQGEKKEKKEQ